MSDVMKNETTPREIKFMQVQITVNTLPMQCPCRRRSLSQWLKIYFHKNDCNSNFLLGRKQSLFSLLCFCLFKGIVEQSGTIWQLIVVGNEIFGRSLYLDLL